MLNQAERTIFVLETETESTRRLQEQIFLEGGRVLVADDLAHALLIAQNAELDDAWIECEFNRCDEVVSILRRRHVPYIFFSAGSLRSLSEPLPLSLQKSSVQSCASR